MFIITEIAETELVDYFNDEIGNNNFPDYVGLVYNEEEKAQ